MSPENLSSSNQSLTSLIQAELEKKPGVALRRTPRILVAAFEGWNDAAEVATDTVEEIARQTDAELLATFSDEEYYDYQVNRPVVTRDQQGRGTVAWPHTRVLHSPAGTTTSDQPELYFMLGVEPSIRWRSFVNELLDAADSWDVDAIVLVGALLADVPHSRPFTPSLTSSDPMVRDALDGVRIPRYEGPTGIVGLLADTGAARGWPTLSAWVSVPHYVAQAPSPKAILALTAELEEQLGLRLDLNVLGDEAAAWERGVDQLAASDPDVATYIEQLEEALDTEDLPEATGESIAREFERYLKRRDEEGHQGNGNA